MEFCCWFFLPPYGGEDMQPAGQDKTFPYKVPAHCTHSHFVCNHINNNFHPPVNGAAATADRTRPGTGIAYLEPIQTASQSAS